MIALAHVGAPFSDVILCDLDPENVAALRTRTHQRFACEPVVIEGDCNAKIGEIVSMIPTYGLNLAFIDPFGYKTFHFETIEKLAAFARMDLIIHIPIYALRINFHTKSGKDGIDRMLGTDRWREVVKSVRDIHLVMDVLREQLVSLGYTGTEVRSRPIKNNSGGLLYYLFFASKNPSATKSGRGSRAGIGRGSESCRLVRRRRSRPGKNERAPRPGVVEVGEA